jgi:hypothetical protein
METLMENKLITIGQFDGDAELLKIDLSTGEASLVPAHNFDKSKICFGMYESEKNGSSLDYVALIATAEGPLLFLKTLQYRPEIGKTQIKIQDDDEYCSFRVLHAGQPVFGCFYERKFGIGLHPYNRGREDVDFYYWLSKHITDPKLYKVYSRDIVYAN